MTAPTPPEPTLIADYVVCDVCRKAVLRAEALRHPTQEIHACGPCYGYLILRAEGPRTND